MLLKNFVLIGTPNFSTAMNDDPATLAGANDKLRCCKFSNSIFSVRYYLFTEMVLRFACRAEVKQSADEGGRLASNVNHFRFLLS